MGRVNIYQGEDITIVVTTDSSILNAAEIEFIIETPTVIRKLKTLAEISEDSGTQFTVTINAADTSGKTPGSYSMQSRITDGSSKKANCVYSPPKINILRSLAFTS